jgi:hypothetical protein
VVSKGYHSISYIKKRPEYWVIRNSGENLN